MNKKFLMIVSFLGMSLVQASDREQLKKIAQTHGSAVRICPQPTRPNPLSTLLFGKKNTPTVRQCPFGQKTEYQKMAGAIVDGTVDGKKLTASLCAMAAGASDICLKHSKHHELGQGLSHWFRSQMNKS